MDSSKKEQPQAFMPTSNDSLSPKTMSPSQLPLEHGETSSRAFQSSLIDYRKPSLSFNDFSGRSASRHSTIDSMSHDSGLPLYVRLSEEASTTADLIVIDHQRSLKYIYPNLHSLTPQQTAIGLIREQYTL